MNHAQVVAHPAFPSFLELSSAVILGEAVQGWGEDQAAERTNPGPALKREQRWLGEAEGIQSDPSGFMLG